MTSVPKTSRECVSLWKDDRKVSELLKQDEGRKALLNVVSTELMNFCSVISVPTKINTDNVWIVAEKFSSLNDVRHLSLRELKYFFKQAFDLKYGKLYGGFGYDTLIDWFNAYFTERTREFASHQENEHIKNTSSEKRHRDKAFPFGNDTPGVGDLIEKI